jgi:hypothetical protein
LFYELAGVYIFTAIDQGVCHALYVGETDNFYDRLSKNLGAHHKYPAALALGTRHVCVIQVPGERARRLAVETDRRRALKPRLNDQ